MPLIKYEDIKLGDERKAKIVRANAIIAEYAAQGFQLTLRQLYYQHVARGIIANNEREYKNLGTLINDGRMVGLIDWNSIVDRTRNLVSNPHWADPPAILDVVANQFAIDKWATQPYHVEVWIEKDALVGVIENVCTELDVPYFSCRGYTSQSEVWTAGRRLRQYHLARKQKPIILHLGDHDPSGVDMTRDVTDRLALFAETDVEVRRLALNWAQVEEYAPPPNPTKLTDSRATGYISSFGHECWELDALEPRVIEALIRDEVMALRDEDAWAEQIEIEDDGKATLSKISEQYDDVKAFVEKSDA